MRGERTLLYSGCALFTETATGRQCVVEMDYYQGEHGLVWMVARYDGRQAPPRAMTPERAEEVARSLFPAPSANGAGCRHFARLQVRILGVAD